MTPAPSWRHGSLVLFLAVRLLATVAVQMLSVGVGWQVYALTGDVPDLGWLGLAQFVPFVPLVPLAEHSADRFSRKRIIALCYGMELVCALLLIAFTLLPNGDVRIVFAVLFGGATALLPAYAHDILAVGPAGLGMLRTAPVLGAAATGLMLAFNPWHATSAVRHSLASLSTSVRRRCSLSRCGCGDFRGCTTWTGFRGRRRTRTAYEPNSARPSRHNPSAKPLIELA